jgi:hypothetical protein
VVHFGDRWPVVPEAVIEELRATLGADAVHVISEELQPGEAVQIADGVFHGLRAVVTRVMPSRERVAVLLEFLGRQTTVELPNEALIRDMDERKLVLYERRWPERRQWSFQSPEHNRIPWIQREVLASRCVPQVLSGRW